MTSDDEFLLWLDCAPIEMADPEVRASVKDVRQQLETAGISDRHLMHARTGTIMASTSMLGPYLLSAAGIVVPTLGAILIAWIKAAPTRKVRVRVGDVRIEANSVEDMERLIPELEKLQAIARRKSKP